MNLYLKQKVMSLHDRFTVYDENEAPLYTVEGKVVSVHRKHSIFNNNGEEVANISKKVLSWMPKFFIECPVGTSYEMKGKMAFAHEKCEIEQLGWVLTGKFLQHDYTICKGDEEIASIHEKWLTWGDTYEIPVNEGIDPVMVLAVMLCIDAIHEEDNEITAEGSAATLIHDLSKK